MFTMHDKQTRYSALKTWLGLARQFAVVIATLALLASLYLVILLGA